MANTVAFNSKTLREWVELVLTGNSKTSDSHLVKAVYGELIESAGNDKDASDYLSPLNALISDLHNLKSSLEDGTRPENW